MTASTIADGRAPADAEAQRGGVALTFDDGPDPVWTPRVLAALSDCGVRATFFVMGSAAERFPSGVRDAVAAGHDVQLHCHEHRRHTTLTRAELARDTDRALLSLAALGVEPTLWRTPWGVEAPFTAEVAAERRLSLVHWTADTEDWAGEPADALLTRIASRLVPGAIVLLHDGLGPGALRDGAGETVALIPHLVAACRAADLEPGPVNKWGQAPFIHAARAGLSC